MAKNRDEYIHCARPTCDGIVTLKLNEQEKHSLVDNSGNSGFSMTLRPCNVCHLLTCKMCLQEAQIDVKNPHVCEEMEDALDE